MQIKNIGENVYQIDNQIATVNLTPTKQVYQEKLIPYEDKEFRLWNPRRLKVLLYFHLRKIQMYYI